MSQLMRSVTTLPARLSFENISAHLWWIHWCLMMWCLGRFRFFKAKPLHWLWRWGRESRYGCLGRRVESSFSKSVTTTAFYSSDCYSLSVLKRTSHPSMDSVKHYRISCLQNSWVYISPGNTFPSLHHLVEHYSGLCALEALEWTACLFEALLKQAHKQKPC